MLALTSTTDKKCAFFHFIETSSSSELQPQKVLSQLKKSEGSFILERAANERDVNFQQPITISSRCHVAYFVDAIWPIAALFLVLDVACWLERFNIFEFELMRSGRLYLNLELTGMWRYRRPTNNITVWNKKHASLAQSRVRRDVVVISNMAMKPSRCCYDVK